MSKARRVFISYSHDSPEHSARVLALAGRLRREGVDARLERYEAKAAQGCGVTWEGCPDITLVEAGAM